jgi:hypothetical protein
MNYVALPMSRTMAILDVCRSSNVPGGSPGSTASRSAAAASAAAAPARHALHRPRPDGRLRQGVTICAGMGTTCQQVNQPRARACNGFDNDCDGMPSTTGTTSARTNQVCDRGQCVDRCQPELGCLTGRTCSDRGTCVETSCLNVTCPAGQRCSGGRCVGRLRRRHLPVGAATAARAAASTPARASCATAATSATDDPGLADGRPVRRGLPVPPLRRGPEPASPTAAAPKTRAPASPARRARTARPAPAATPARRPGHHPLPARARCAELGECV